MTDEPLQTEPGRGRRRAWQWGVSLLVLALLVAGGAWWFVGRRVWTDDATIRRANAERELREVLWTPPQALGDAFNTEEQEYEPSVSADGTEVYFVRGKPDRNADVFVSYRRGGAWAAPEPVASVNTDGDELGPRLTPDGRFLLFYSDRDGGLGQYDIWAAPRLPGEAGGFGEPFNLGPAVNSEFNEYSPAPAPDGTALLFASNRKSATSEQREPWRATIRQTDSGDYDIFLARLEPSAAVGPLPPALPPTRGAAPAGDATTPPATAPSTAPTHVEPDGGLAYQPAEELQGVNTPHHDGASCMSPAGDFLYFASNRPGGHGKFDLYRGRLRNGVVGAVENLGPTINTPDNDTDPQLAVGGFHLLFSSDRADSRGGYDLLAAESREVYARRDARPLPAVGWSWWLLLLAVAALLPLLFFLRGWDDHRLNLLQKCLLVSILFHVVLTVLFSLYNVSRDIVQYVKRQQEMELALDLRAPETEAIIAAEIRGQPRLDLPVQAPQPLEVAQLPTADIPLETLEPVDAAELTVPQARLDPRQMVVEVPAPRAEPPEPAEVPEVATTEPPVRVPEIRIEAPRAQVRADEMLPPAPAVAPDAEVARLELPAAAVPAAPEAVQVEVRPTEIEIGSLAEAADAPAPDRRAEAEMAAAAAPALVAEPDVRAPPAAAAPVAGDEASLPEPADAEAALQRQGVAVAVAGPEAVSPEVPTAEVAAARESLATAPEMKRDATPAPEALPVPVEAPLTEDRVDVEIRAAVERVAVRPAPDAAEQVQPALPKAGRSEAGDATALAARPVEVGAEPARPKAEPDALQALAGPTTRPSVVEAAEPAVPAESALRPDIVPAEIAAARMAKAGGREEPEVAAAAAEVNVAPERRQPAPEDDAQAAAVQAAVPAAAPEATPSLSDAARSTPRMLTEDTEAPAPVVASAPDVTLPAAAGPKVASADQPPVPAAGNDEPMLTVRTDAKPEPDAPKSLTLEPTPNPTDAKPADALAPGAVVPRVEVVDVSVGPQLSATLPELTAPEAMFQRAEAKRKPLVEKMGGTKQSEEAVDRGLAYLARQQEPDGRWTRVDDDGPPGKRGKGPHDMACTALSVLAFLGADHTPAKPGPYRDVVERGLDFLLATQGPDGDLRGYPERRGGGSGSANMYDHGIACLALGEAGIMTGDKRYIDAALKGAAFIVAAQHRDTGGWRYTPGEPGDTSVFGWQVMALHSAEQLGFELPAPAREGVARYAQIASTGPRKMLGGYTPGAGPTFAMTAELLFARILLGQAFEDADVKEAGDYLLQHPASPGGDIYGWYYASLALVQFENDAWRAWNERCRETLVATQRKGGPSDGCWDANMRWGDHAGRIYTTALATLTLEVYYRYLPMVQKK